MAAPTNHGFYRSDIDGLRALAVVPVILFHANITCPGGFIGVDIFFVISGYLITGIIERDVSDGRFSIIDFYNRRIRRIFPAMFAMMTVSTLIALLTLPPNQLKDLGKSILATAAFCANILDYRHSGYFDTSSQYDPLLHMWTLSVEEQFYVFWPLMLWTLGFLSLSKYKIRAIGVILISSLALSVYWINNNPNAAFYLLPSRAWELALGSALAIMQVQKLLQHPSRIAADACSLIGLAMVVASIVAYDSATPFPGIAALLPCLGALVIIYSSTATLSAGGQLLSFRPIVFTGAISYSLYLWHWPILVFARLIINRELTYSERILLIILTFIVAWISYIFIETPFRGGRFARVSRFVWIGGGLVSALSFVAIGAIVYVTDGVAVRSPSVALWVAKESIEGDTFQQSSCLARGRELPEIRGCLLGAPSPTLDYDGVLWGDSHATQFAPAIEDIGKQLGLTIREITKAGCAPVPGVKFLPIAEMRLECPTFNDAASREVLNNKHIKFVIMAARWDSMVNGNILLTVDGSRPTINNSRNLLITRLRDIIGSLIESGKKVILISQVPLPGQNIIDCIARARFNHADEAICQNTSTSDRLQIERNVDEMLSSAVNGMHDTQIVFPYKQLCQDGACKLCIGGRLLYMDDTHLSAAGALLASIDLEPSLATALGLRP